jgi:superoxide reductase
MSDAPVLGPVNHVTDLDAAGDFEKKHTPNISATREGDLTTILVQVGHYVAHPNQPDHFIEWIELRVGDAPIARFDMAAVAVEPTISCVARLDSGTVVTAIECCNLHGLWAATTTV